MTSFSYFRCVCDYLLLQYEWGKNMDGPAKGINTKFHIVINNKFCTERNYA